jgi:hypothetical protein
MDDSARDLTSRHQPFAPDLAKNFGERALSNDHRLVWPEIKIAANALRTSTETCRIARTPSEVTLTSLVPVPGNGGQAPRVSLDVPRFAC